MGQAFNPNAIGQVVPAWAGGGGPGGVLPAGTTTGEMLYWDQGLGAWIVLPVGAAGQHLETNGAGFAPSWENVPDGQEFESYELGSAIYPASQSASPGVAATDVPTIDFAQAADSDILIASAMDAKYDGGTINVDIYWFAGVAIVGDVRWEVSFVNQTGGNLVTRAFAGPQFVVTTVPGVINTIVQSTVAFTQVQADGIAAGDPYRVRIRRAGAAGTDTMADTAQVIAATMVEP
jgi:hypothetical protein